MIHIYLHRSDDSVHFFEYRPFRETFQIRELSASLKSCTCVRVQFGCASCNVRVTHMMATGKCIVGLPYLIL